LTLNPGRGKLVEEFNHFGADQRASAVETIGLGSGLILPGRKRGKTWFNRPTNLPELANFVCCM